MAAISLKTKMTCAVSLLVALLLFAAGHVSLAYFERQLKETISRQQFTMVSAMADQIDDKMFTAQQVLVLVAKTITPEVVGDPAKAQHFIDRRLVSPLLFDNGRVLGILGIYSDITERKRGETELKHTLSLLAATLEATADGILVTDLTGRIVSFNRRFAEMWLIPEELLTNQEMAKSRSFVLDQ